jgi:hypothetical protein
MVSALAVRLPDSDATPSQLMLVAYHARALTDNGWWWWRGCPWLLAMPEWWLVVIGDDNALASIG